jgi:Ser/Thr protein kinase RdoA (MazF antagonist)
VFSTAEAERIARDVYGLAVAVKPLSGERDCNFQLRTADGREFVLKIVDGAAQPEATDCQIRVLRHLAEIDPSLPVPKVFATQAGTDLGSALQGGHTSPPVSWVISLDDCWRTPGRHLPCY